MYSVPTIISHNRKQYDNNSKIADLALMGQVPGCMGLAPEGPAIVPGLLTFGPLALEQSRNQPDSGGSPGLLPAIEFKNSP